MNPSETCKKEISPFKANSETRKAEDYVVWAILDDDLYWPGKVKPGAHMSRKDHIHLLVYIFGKNRYIWVRYCDIMPYMKYKNVFEKVNTIAAYMRFQGKNGKNLVAAMTAVEDYLRESGHLEVCSTTTAYLRKSSCYKAVMLPCDHAVLTETHRIPTSHQSCTNEISNCSRVQKCSVVPEDLCEKQSEWLKLKECSVVIDVSNGVSKSSARKRTPVVPTLDVINEGIARLQENCTLLRKNHIGPVTSASVPVRRKGASQDPQLRDCSVVLRDIFKTRKATPRTTDVPPIIRCTEKDAVKNVLDKMKLAYNQSEDPVVIPQKPHQIGKRTKRPAVNEGSRKRTKRPAVNDGSRKRTKRPTVNEASLKRLGPDSDANTNSSEDAINGITRLQENCTLLQKNNAVPVTSAFLSQRKQSLTVPVRRRKFASQNPHLRECSVVLRDLFKPGRPIGPVTKFRHNIQCVNRDAVKNVLDIMKLTFNRSEDPAVIPQKPHRRRRKYQECIYTKAPPVNEASLERLRPDSDTSTDFDDGSSEDTINSVRTEEMATLEVSSQNEVGRSEVPDVIDITEIKLEESMHEDIPAIDLSDDPLFDHPDENIDYGYISAALGIRPHFLQPKVSMRVFNTSQEFEDDDDAMCVNNVDNLQCMKEELMLSEPPPEEDNDALLKIPLASDILQPKVSMNVFSVSREFENDNNVECINRDHLQCMKEELMLSEPAPEEDRDVLKIPLTNGCAGYDEIEI